MPKKSLPVTARGPFDDDPRYEVELVGARKIRALLRQCAEHRESIGLTQTEVARVMGTSQSAVSDLESHQVSPRITTLIRYVAALGGSLTLDPCFGSGKPADPHGEVTAPAPTATAPMAPQTAFATPGARNRRRAGIAKKWSLDPISGIGPTALVYDLSAEPSRVQALERVDIEATSVAPPVHPLYVPTIVDVP